MSWAQQMQGQYENVDHFITHYGFRTQPLTWNSEAHFGGRFTLTVQVPVDVDYRARTVTVAGEPKFYLHAVDSIERLPDGRFRASYAGHLQNHFDKDLWDQFVASEFDLSVLGVPEAEQYEVSHFEDYSRAVQAPRVKIELPGT